MRALTSRNRFCGNCAVVLLYFNNFKMTIGVYEDIYNPDSIQGWPLSRTLPGLSIVLILYLVLVKIILPAFMKGKPAYELKNTLKLYNAFQVAYSAYLVFIYTRYALRHGVIVTNCPQGQELQKVIEEIYPYFIAKHLDLLDTVFFILRKKDNQATFLHVYHHTAMVTWTWLHYVHYPTDNFVVVGLLNSFVHVLMYAYYGISSLGPEFAKYIWWKKHLTKIQLVQFILVILNLYYQQKLSPCPIPWYFQYYCTATISCFFVLFMKFYINSYNKQKKISVNSKIN
ncbi:elongation of very long chain fatty acids protein 7-like [Galleria mellonella]|uniref:Elongation of very long chain fatty acids protein n=1 Tax=Galleria mellonella TaxID=7137 RepID=A0A6J1WF76_GALME|nr:elongation of very long chain fatty acids protein 7-like [Galleria mellonella]